MKTEAVRSVSGPLKVGAAPLMTLFVGFIMVILGLLVARPVVIALGMALVLHMVWTWIQRPEDAAHVSIENTRFDPESGDIVGDLAFDPPAGAGITRIEVDAPSHRRVTLVLDTSRAREVTLRAAGTRTGRREVFVVAYQSSSSDGLFYFEKQIMGPSEAVILPRAAPVQALPLPFRLQGMTGAHDSPRLGEGWEIHDVARFRPGDRLRRIDWRASARRIQEGAGASTGQMVDLYVRRTHATADAVVVMIIDSRDDFGPDVATWLDTNQAHPDDATSLDIARHVVASLATHYLGVGDRVGVVDLGRPWRQLRPASGRRHIHRLIQQVAEAVPVGEPSRQVRAPALSSASQVVMMSTFLDNTPVDMATTWRRIGHRVLAVDVLPPLVFDHLKPKQQIEFKILDMERQERLWRLNRIGVEVIPWHPDPLSGQRSISAGLATAARARRRR